MAIEEFQSLLRNVTTLVAGEKLGDPLAEKLNKNFPPESKVFMDIQQACISAIEEGWMCKHENGGIKFGRVIKDLDGFSIDVVFMNTVVGPHHRHPKGEIDMIMPLSGKANFDGVSKGWLVYGPNSDHSPTVTDGEAIILYLLPDGAIEFTSN